MKKVERRIFNQWVRKYPFLWAINQSRWDLVNIYADRVGRFGFHSLMAGRMTGGEVWAYYETGVSPAICQVEVDSSDAYVGIKNVVTRLQNSLGQGLTYVIFVDTTSICICKEPPAGWPMVMERFLAGMNDERRSIMMEF